MIRGGLIAALGVWLATSASVASAMLVTWTISGTASTGGAPLDFFPNDSAYVLTITFESAAPPTYVAPGHTTIYESAIVAATFESATYSPEIELTPPASSQITATLFDTTFFMGVPGGLSDEHPFLRLSYPSGLLVPTPSGDFPLPIAPPDSDAPIVSIQLIGSAGAYQILSSSVAPSSIDYSVPEPAVSWAGVGCFAIAWLRTTRRKRRCNGASDSRFS